MPFVHQNEVTGINMGNLVCKMVLHHDIIILYKNMISYHTFLYANKIHTEHVSRHSISYSLSITYLLSVSKHDVFACLQDSSHCE